MKKITFTLIATLVSIIIFGQEKSNLKLDKIIKKDYEIIDAVVTKISEKTIEYSFPEDRLIYSLETSKIAVIHFANGKKQQFNDTSATEKPSLNVSEKDPQKFAKFKPNTIAILPIPFVNSETQVSAEEMAKFCQNDMYNKLMEKLNNIYPLTIQDLRETNNLLRKANIDYKNIDETPIDELQQILGVDHILTAKVTFDIKVKQSTHTNSSSNVSINDKNKSVKENDSSSSYTDIDKEFYYIVYFDLYKNSTKIYSQKRIPFFTDKNSWMDSMSYLLKRCPIYVK